MFYAGIILTFALLFLSIHARGENTPMFRGNTEHTGVYNAAGVPSFSQVKWTFHAKGQLISSPAVDSATIYVGSTGGFLYAVDRAAGTEKWKFETRSRIASSPAVANGLVYFSAYDGNFYAVDAAMGKLKWKFQTGGEKQFTAQHLHGMQPASQTMPDPWDCWLSSPAIWKGAVYFGSWDSYFYAIDAATGAEKWRFKTGEDAAAHNQQGIQSSAAVVDGAVYFGCRDSHLYALDEKTGEKKWAYATGGTWVLNSPAVSQGKVFFAISYGGKLLAADAKTGNIAYSIDFKGWPVYSSPAIAGNMLYVGSTAGTMNAVDLTTQTFAWTYTTDAAKQHGPAFTKTDGTSDYFGVFPSDFYQDVVAAYGKLETMGPVISSPVVVDNMLYFSGMDGNLYALM